MPPANVRFSELPAEVHNPPFFHVGEIAKAHVDILDQDSQLLDRMEVPADLFQRADIVRAGWRPAAEGGFGAGLGDGVLRLKED